MALEIVPQREPVLYLVRYDVDFSDHHSEDRELTLLASSVPVACVLRRPRGVQASSREKWIHGRLTC